MPEWLDFDGWDGKIMVPSEEPMQVWLRSMDMAEKYYNKLIANGWVPQQARSVLPNSLKTVIVVTVNFREWRTIFKQRCSSAAHPQMREVMIPLLVEVKELVPVIFDDITID